MKEKLKKFFIEKKELLIFVGILAIVFTTVVTIANITLKSDDKPVVVPDPTEDTGGCTPDPTIPENPVVVFGLPVDDNAITLRCYYDLSKAESDLETALIVNGNSCTESKGITYANKDDSDIKAYAMYDGTVLSVKTDETRGNVVEIDHGDDIICYYYSLSTVNVKANDKVKKGDLIGVGGSNQFDPEASKHVTVEITVSGKYVDPLNVYSKEAKEVSSLINEGK